MRHHTKDKGDVGVGQIVADLLKNNIQVALPLSEHLPFDCIAISEQNILKRLQIKYRKLEKNGNITVQLKNCWADKHGNHFKKHDKASYDALAIFCPDNNTCYYIRIEEVINTSVSLRIMPSKNNQVKHIKLASNYNDPKKLFL